jgi:hypothetical protein
MSRDALEIGSFPSIRDDKIGVLKVLQYVTSGYQVLWAEQTSHNRELTMPDWSEEIGKRDVIMELPNRCFDLQSIFECVIKRRSRDVALRMQTVSLRLTM